MCASHCGGLKAFRFREQSRRFAELEGAKSGNVEGHSKCEEAWAGKFKKVEERKSFKNCKILGLSFGNFKVNEKILENSFIFYVTGDLIERWSGKFI